MKHNPEKISRHDSKRAPTVCKVCGDVALYSYFGVIVCSPCKMFFKRNATNKQKTFQCHYDGHCSIDVKSRHICSACRLRKCFSSGMQMEMFRSSTSKGKRKTIVVPQSNPSTMSGERWISLVNLIHCFEEYNPFLCFDRFLQAQHCLPVKLRLKAGASHHQQMLMRMMKNDLSSMEHNTLDCFVELQRSIQEVLAWHSSLIVHVSLSPSVLPSYDRISSIDFYSYSPSRPATDPILTKLLLSILICSIFDGTDYRNEYSLILDDVPSLLTMKNIHIELAWQYLSCVYDSARTIRCFSQLTRVLLNIYPRVIHGLESLLYQDILVSVLNQADKALTSSHFD